MRLRRFERRWMVALFSIILPRGADDRLPLGASDLPMGRFADELMRFAPARAALGVRAATWLVYWFGPLWIGRLGPIVRLSESDRVRALDAMADSSNYLVRELPMLLKMVATLGYCGVPAVQRQIGVTQVDQDPPPWARE